MSILEGREVQVACQSWILYSSHRVKYHVCYLYYWQPLSKPAKQVKEPRTSCCCKYCIQAIVGVMRYYQNPSLSCTCHHMIRYHSYSDITRHMVGANLLLKFYRRCQYNNSLALSEYVRLTNNGLKNTFIHAFIFCIREDIGRQYDFRLNYSYRH